jgi:hypothetical protein
MRKLTISIDSARVDSGPFASATKDGMNGLFVFHRSGDNLRFGCSTTSKLCLKGSMSITDSARTSKTQTQLKTCDCWSRPLIEA